MHCRSTVGVGGMGTRGRVSLGWPRPGLGSPHLSYCPGRQYQRIEWHIYGGGARSEEADVDAMGRIVRLALPALVVVISDPLQTLVDSACLGQYSTIHLAAIGPNTAIYNSLFQLCTFLGVTTAHAVARDQEIKSTVGMALFLACVLGSGAMVALSAMGGTILVDMMGTDARVVPYALEYMMTRAMGIPCVLVMNVFQGLCLGLQDTISPMMVCGLVTLLNVLGDSVLVLWCGMGARGAAMATVGAQAVGLVYMVYLIKKKEHHTGKEYIPSSLGDLHSSMKGTEMKTFGTVGGALIARTAAGMAAYFAMATSAMGMGIFAAAAHQVAMQMFWFISYFPEPLSMAAQTLIARDHTKHPVAARQWAWRLVSTGSLVGMALSVVTVATLTWGTCLFSPDIAIQQTVQSLASLGGLAIALCSILMMFDGISIGSGALAHLPIGVAAGLVVVLGILYSNFSFAEGLKGVWWALNGFYATRLLIHLLYYFIFSRLLMISQRDTSIQNVFYPS